MALKTKKVVTVPRNIRYGNDIVDMIDQPAKLFPQKAAFRYRRGGEEHALCFGDMRQFVSAIAAGLIGRGLRGAHVAVIGEKSPEWVMSFVSAIACEGVAVPLDKELTRNEIAGFVQFADCKAVVYTQSYADVFETDDPRLSDVELFIKIDMESPAAELLSGSCDSSTQKFVSLTEVARYGQHLIDGGLELPDSGADVDRMAMIIFTSGTTGTSKGVMLSQRNMVFVCNGSLRYVDIDENDVLLSVLPLHHTYEMTAGLFAPLLCGSTICINDNLSSILADFRHFRPTIMALVPQVVSSMSKRIDGKIANQGKEKAVAMAKLLGDGLNKLGLDVRRKLFADVLEAFGGRLERFVCGGAALDPALVKKFGSFGISVKQGYGITECAPVIGIVPYDVINEKSCGRVLDGLQVMIDKEHPDDETGEICVKGPNVMLGYYKNQQATDEVLSNRGWFATGDCGWMDENRFLYITGRKKNVIVLENGKNVFPEEIEEYLSQVPFIADCIVCSREGVDKKQVLTAVIYPDYDRAKKEKSLESEEDFKEFFKSEILSINKKIASFKQIRNIEIRKSPFPKTTTLKIKRHQVKESE